jgi:hypothetical protein
MSVRCQLRPQWIDSAHPALSPSDSIQVARVETSGSGIQPNKDASELVTDLPTLRFAIAAFDTWAEAQKALHALNAGGKKINDVSYLAQQRILEDAVTSNGRQVVHLFGGTDGGIGCSAGPVADRLAGRLASGATTMKAALGRWLIPRHAAHLQQAVDEGKILLWVQLFDNDEERRAYQSLLATSSNSVGVHDLVGT